MDIIFRGPPWIQECLIMWGVPTVTGRTCVSRGGPPVLQPNPGRRFLLECNDPEYCLQCWITFWVETGQDCQEALYTPAINYDTIVFIAVLTQEILRVPRRAWPSLLRACASFLEGTSQSSESPTTPTRHMDEMASHTEPA